LPADVEPDDVEPDGVEPEDVEPEEVEDPVADEVGLADAVESSGSAKARPITAKSNGTPKRASHHQPAGERRYRRVSSAHETTFSTPTVRPCAPAPGGLCHFRPASP
jgi:hypothetical protein